MAYTVSITLDTPRPQRISRDLAILSGKADLTSYNTSQSSAEITSITGKFKTTKAIVADGFTDNGYAVNWNRSTGTFRAYYPTAQQSAPVSTSVASVAAAAGSEVSNSVDVGAFNFIAIGMV